MGLEVAQVTQFDVEGVQRNFDCRMGWFLWMRSSEVGFKVWSASRQGFIMSRLVEFVDVYRLLILFCNQFLLRRWRKRGWTDWGLLVIDSQAELLCLAYKLIAVRLLPAKSLKLSAILG